VVGSLYLKAKERKVRVKKMILIVDDDAVRMSDTFVT
jgi:hypothetical protein